MVTVIPGGSHEDRRGSDVMVSVRSPRVTGKSRLTGSTCSRVWDGRVPSKGLPYVTWQFWRNVGDRTVSQGDCTFSRPVSWSSQGRRGVVRGNPSSVSSPTTSPTA